MPYIFRFHAGRNNNIYDWKASDRIMPEDVREVKDKTNVLSSAAGTSIPTPIARMFLFKTAFEIVAAQVRDNELDGESIYSGLVSETLDLIELLYKSGNDQNKFRYVKWVFDTRQGEDDKILNFFGSQHGHRLLAESFKQSITQAPFNGIFEITLIYYKEGGKEILLGGTSPYTFVFTSPNFKRKSRERGFRAIAGLVSNDYLFDSDYKQLHERDESFIKYVESLVNTEGIGSSFKGIAEYVINTRNRNYNKFNGAPAFLENIQSGNTLLSVANVTLQQISQEAYKQTINVESDFKIDLPAGTYYTAPLKPLFLYDRMPYDGQYSSKSSVWSSTTPVNENDYPETSLDEITERKLPRLGLSYPFFSSFDFFERCLVKLPGYFLNDERFLCLAKDQTFLFPIKPIFFHLFPIDKIKDYLSVEVKNDQYTFTLKIPVFGNGKKRSIPIKKTYDIDSTITYSGILGIFPFVRANEEGLKHINKYTISAYEKTNVPTLIDSIKYFKADGIKDITSPPSARSNYANVNTKTSYYQVNESFDIIQLNFTKDNSGCGGVIIPRFTEVKNGTDEYIYSIDFGTSNTHIEYSVIVDDDAKDTNCFEVNETNMLFTLLNKPIVVKENDGATQYNDYEKSMGTTIDSARQITLREFMPFQFGLAQGPPFRFPFRTSTIESKSFIQNKKARVFHDANIGFNIENDTLDDTLNYQTDIKWQLESNLNDDQRQSRVSIFFRQLLLMIRTHALLIKNQQANLDKLRIAMSFPTSMDQDLQDYLLGSFKGQMKELFDIKNDDLLADRLIEVNESIAPYYHLLKQDSKIQLDTYCNIDIGGGTSDIVIVKKESNILNCYCTSVKFAGKQLWGSVSNDYDSNDNGFLLFYKNFLSTKKSEQFEEIKKLLEGKNRRTEDVVSYLFSKEEYKFRQIFTQCKDLKVPLLIHYATILFYVARLCKMKGIELPKTVSFSGKGSEYLTIIFSSDELLKQFTKKALSIFSGLSSNIEFGIKRSPEPKVITAKGSVIYGSKPRKKVLVDEFGNDDSSKDDSGEAQIKDMEVSFHGSNDIEFEKSEKTYEDFLESKPAYKSIILNCVDFINIFFDNDDLIKGSQKALNIDDLSKYRKFFIPSKDFDVLKNGVLRNSFLSALEKKSLTKPAVDPPFFFAFNTALIELSKDIATKNLSK